MEDFIIEELDEEFNKGSGLLLDINSLIKEIEEHRILRFVKTNVQSIYPKLLAEGILYEDGTIVKQRNIAIKNEPIFLYAFYKHFSHLLNFQLSDNINEFLDFVDNIGSYLTEQGERAGIHSLTKAMINFLLIFLQKKVGVNFHEYSLSFKLSNKKDSRYQYLQAYLEILSTSTLHSQEFWKIIKHLTIEIGGPKPGYMDFGWREFENTIIKYCATNPSAGSELKGLSLAEVDTPVLQELIFPIFLGCVDAKILPPEELVQFLDNTRIAKYSLAVLTSRLPTEPQIRISIINKLEDSHDWDELTDLQIPRLLIFLLQSEDVKEDSLQNRYKKLFKKYSLSDNEKIVYACFHAINNYKGEDDFFISILKELFLSDHFKNEYFQLINGFFLQHIDIHRFFDFIKFLSHHLSLKFEDSSIREALDAHWDFDEQQFEKELMLLIIDEVGPVRWAAHQILFGRSSISETLRLSVDLLTLDAVSQYKVIISIVTPFQQVNKIVPIVAPLIASPFSVVVELLLCKLEELIDGYKAEVIDVFTAEIAELKIKKADSLSRLNNYLQNLGDEISKKIGIKELDPNFTQRGLVRSYNQAFMKKSKIPLRSERKQTNSILDFATQITVARGGGFIVPGQKKITPLKHISVSWTMPRTMFIQPEAMNYYRLEHFTKNWKDEYKGWERIISS